MTVKKVPKRQELHADACQQEYMRCDYLDAYGK